MARAIGRKQSVRDPCRKAMNIAARMQFHAKHGDIRVSAPTRDLLEDRCVFEASGDIHARMTAGIHLREGQ